ncbi:MAG: hypothetical protein ACR2LQ_06700 [Acidimicrobiales bacterium]
MTDQHVPSRLARIALIAIGLTLAMVGCGGGGRSAKAFCDSLRSGADPVALFAADGGNADQVGQGITRLRELEAKAPSPAREAVQQLITVATDIQAVLRARSQSSAGAPPATVAPGDADVAARASSTVEQYAATECAITLGPTTVPPSSP